MLPYALIWGTPALFALSSARLDRRLSAVLLVLGAAALTVFIGLRFRVGTDWFNYFAIQQAVHAAPGWTFLLVTEPAYALLNRWAGAREVDIVPVNLACAAIFVSGFVRYCRNQPYPAHGLAVGVAYVGVVVAMGYTRQSAAMGLLFWGLVDLARGRTLVFLVFVAAATLFHKSAIVMAPLIFFGPRRISAWWLLLLLPVAAGAIIGFMIDQIQGKVAYYTAGVLKSEGAPLRVAMNAVPAAILLATRRGQARLWPHDIGILVAMSWLALGSVPLVFLFSTFADRIALYLVVLQLAIYGRLAVLLAGRWRAAVYVGSLAIYGLVLAVWLSSSYYAQCCWLPYRWAL